MVRVSTESTKAEASACDLFQKMRMVGEERGQELDVLIVGAGFAGLYALYKMRSMGLVAAVLEAAPSVGGTWYANRYPGARVDIPSLDYSFSFSEDLQQEWHWTERYASQPELLRYANHVADRFGLRDGIRLNTRVTAAQFDDGAQLWRVTAEDGRAWTAPFLIMASGPLSTPNMPAFEGLGSFAGPVLHSAAWPHEPVEFSGRHVAVVGTGSSAAQIIRTSRGRLNRWSSSSARRPMQRRPTTVPLTLRSKRESKPTTPATAHATGSCGRASTARFHPANSQLFR